MKRRVKRKVFLMSMAVAAHWPALTHAATMNEGNPASPRVADEIQEDPVIRAGSEFAESMMQKLTEGLRAAQAAMTDEKNDWKVDLYSEEPSRLGMSAVPKAMPRKPVGVEWRMKF